MTLPLSLELTEQALDELLAGRRPPEADGLPEAIETTMAELRDAPCELEMARGERSGYGWGGPRLAALVVPAGERWMLHVVPTDFVPDVLARLNDLVPRPEQQLAAPVRFDPGLLAQAVARGEHEVTRGLREHWRVDALWPAGPDRVARRSVEVLDTEDGLWLVTPMDAQVELEQVRPAEVFRRLCGLLPTPAEL